MTNNDISRSALLSMEAPAKANVRVVRVALEQAALIPALMLPPPPTPTPRERTAEAWENVRKSPLFTPARFRHLRPGFLDRVPLRLFGVDADSGRRLYRDTEGLRRALLPDEHDQAGIASLFSGSQIWLCRL
jgi:hypothetical protein